MKAILFICLVAFICSDMIDVLKCIYESDLVQDIIQEAIKAIATQDYSKLIEKITGCIPELIQVIIGCIL